MKYLKILFLIICCFLNVSTCYAVASISVGFNDPNSGSSSSGPTPGDTDGDGMIDGKYIDGDYTCEYHYKVSYSSDVEIYGFDINNNSIIDKQVTPKKKIKAGTSIGIAIIETKSASWKYKFKVTKKTQSCTKYYNYVCITSGTPPVIKYKEFQEGKQDAGCSKVSTTPREVCSDGSPKEVKSGSEFTKCKEKAESFVSSVNSGIKSKSYNGIKLLNANDDDSKKVNNISTKSSCSKCLTTKEEGNCSCTHTYTPEAVCINKETAEVEYSDNTCEPEEFQIKNEVVKSNGKNVEHFHYFVPLNVTDGWFSLVLNESNVLKTAKWCKDAIDANPDNYADFFVGAPLIKGGEKIPLSPGNTNLAKKNVKNGCYIKTEIRIPVSEGIYDVNNEKIDGYNLFVRNTSEINPFPNAVTNKDSLWFEWYKKNYSGGKYTYNEVAPNIKNSFTDTSYVLKDVNAKRIRNLKKDKDYLGSYFKTSVDLTGKSEFVHNDINFDKSANANNYYKLGCGPLNSTKKIIVNGVEKENPLYQEGCQ